MRLEENSNCNQLCFRLFKDPVKLSIEQDCIATRIFNLQHNVTRTRPVSLPQVMQTLKRNFTHDRAEKTVNKRVFVGLAPRGIGQGALNGRVCAKKIRNTK